MPETPPRPDVPDDLLTLAADAIRRYDWDTGLSANPDVSKHQRRPSGSGGTCAAVDDGGRFAIGESR